VNPEIWVEWLPYVELSYNTLINSTTRYSPYELLFRRVMNDFKDWKVVISEATEAQLIKRAVQIRDLVEGKRINALANIDRAQVKQKRVQNARNNVCEDFFKEGTPVMIKVEGIKEKLENRNRGKYFIKGRT
jgi:hypothetical protein